MILSDQFTVRAYSSHEAWKPGPMKVQAGDKAASGPKTLSSWLSSLNPQLQAQLQEAVASIVSIRFPYISLSPLLPPRLSAGTSILHSVAVNAFVISDNIDTRLILTFICVPFSLNLNVHKSSKCVNGRDSTFNSPLIACRATVGTSIVR